MLFDVASHGERSAGFEVPCLIVAAKNDVMCPYATAALQDSVGVHSSLRIEKPICISTKLGDVNHIFPHLNIPETEAGRTCKFYRQFVSYSLVILSGHVLGVWDTMSLLYSTELDM
ncbi:Mitochondrial rho gtpase [Thalictrum thalictroides]|uniref:Mitochondrial rho gtpase n=1 Tax=Thalictrum thalictroides TaxID=46969 RepID=A0A7J6V8Z5_THATH|nr:Mitochondrial rho gtpase [Thalictrum thalictroides]